MNTPHVLHWIESTRLSVAIREGGLPYPVLGLFHLMAIAWFGGMLLVSDLRLLGWVMAGRPVSEVLGQFRAWKHWGLALIAGTGFFLWWCEPVHLWHSPSFWIKMVCFALVGVHALVFRSSVYGNPEQLDKRITTTAKVAAVLSLLLWVALIVSGRWIAFDE